MSDNWPVVRENDAGADAWNVGRCIYCEAKVNEQHGKDCVAVVKMVRYRVLHNGVDVGHYVTSEPHSWDAADGESHRNRGFWCKTNAVAHITWNDTDQAAALRVMAAGLTDDGLTGNDCWCHLLEFRFDCVIDETPIVR